MTDRMTAARTALENSARAFREYEAHHQSRADDEIHRTRKEDAARKAARNRALAIECEMVLALLVAQ